MTITHIQLSQLVPSKANPRKAFDTASIEGLAASIRTDGLLQNLVVRPQGGKGKSKRYAIISGERRFRALKLLDEQEALPEHFTVPVEIRTKLSKDERLRLATVENLQRANLTPLEETAALTGLIHKGESLDDVAAQTGLSPATIKRRLALGNLCDEAKAALDDGTLSLAQAEALTLGGAEAQNSILEEIERGYRECSANDIRSMLFDDRPSVADAVFPLEQYTGTITTDLFAESERSYFDDAEQFYELQKDAVDALAKRYEETAAWVEVTERWHVPMWQYQKAEDGETGGLAINLDPRGKVEIVEGLIKPEIDEDTLEQTAENPCAPVRKMATYSAPVRRYIAHHKSLAVQELLLSSPRKAKEIAVLKMLSEFTPHAGLVALAKEVEPQTSYTVINETARRFAVKLGFELVEDEHGWEAFDCYPDQEDLYDAVSDLSDHDLDELQTLLTALSFGQSNCNELDCSESVFNRVAIDLGADMKNHWRPDRSFVSRRNRAQLIDISKACGHAEGRSAIQSYKKAELVEGILNHIAFAHSAESPSETQQKALDWLPEAMTFPAVNPDGLSDVSDDDLPDPDDAQTDTAPDDADQDVEQDAQEIEVAIAA